MFVELGELGVALAELTAAHDGDAIAHAEQLWKDWLETTSTPLPLRARASMICVHCALALHVDPARRLVEQERRPRRGASRRARATFC